MKQVPIKLGPLALLLTVISICLTTLAILTFTTAQADVRLAEKYANTIRLRYELETEGQRWLADVQSGNAISDADGRYTETFEKDGSVLTITAEMKNSVLCVTKWKQERVWEEDSDIGNLWNGLR